MIGEAAPDTHLGGSLSPTYIIPTPVKVNKGVCELCISNIKEGNPITVLLDTSV